MTTIASRIPRARREAQLLPAAALRRPNVSVMLICGLALGLFLYRLGHSSFFIDEVYSWIASRGDFGSIEQAVRFNEVTPPLYYVIMHGWMAVTGSESEAMLRLPSVFVGVAFVASVYWLATLLSGRSAGLIAATLAMLSPLTLMYAQQVRSYIWVMLAVTIAVAAAVRAIEDDGERAGRWLALSLAACAASVLLHYVALFITIPLVLWVLRRQELTRTMKLTFVGVAALPVLALLPLMLEQLAQGHTDGNAAYAQLNAYNLVRIFGTPFDGRASTGVMLGRELGVVAAIDALALIAFAARFKDVKGRGLLLVLALLPLVVVVAVSATLQPVAMTRYTVVAAPFIIIAIAIAVVHAPKALGGTLLAIALAASIMGLFAAQVPSGQNPDMRGAVAVASKDFKKGDQVMTLNLLGYDGALDYYASRMLPAGSQDVRGFGTLQAAVDAPVNREALADGKRLWFVSDPVMSRAEIRRALGSVGYALRREQTFVGNATIQLVLAAPEKQ